MFNDTQRRELATAFVDPVLAVRGLQKPAKGLPRLARWQQKLNSSLKCTEARRTDWGCAYAAL